MMNSTRGLHVLLAVEGGGSKGRAALRYGGKTIFNACPRGLNPLDVDDEAFRERFGALVLPLLDSIEARASSIRACLAVAGCGRPEVARRCERIVTDMLSGYTPRLRTGVLSDADALVGCCLTETSGIALIAGTGSVCVGVRRRAGRVTTSRVGGWGSYLDDGSGFRIGLDVLMAALRSLDGRSRPGIMTEILCRNYGISKEEIPMRFLPPERDRVAALAGVALEAYTCGDRSARSIIRRAVGDLADMVLAAKSGAGLGKRFAVFLSGGLFLSAVMRRLVKRRLRSALPGVEFHHITDILPQLLGIAGTMRARG
jgi:N-acetylglucosamine kinase-like BadF-type ATPase